MHRVALVAVASLLLFVPASAAVAKRAVPAGFYGVDYDREIPYAGPSILARTWATMATSGVESVRVKFDWGLAQPRADAPPSFTGTDALVALAAAHGMRLVPVVMPAPRWARVEPDMDASRPSDLSAYAAYLQGLVRRYGPNGTFWTDRPDLPKRAIRVYQAWNEPDMAYQWWPRGKWQKHYGELLARAYQAVKQVDPHAKVVMAALTNYSWQSLRSLYRHGHIRGHFDAIALNPFTRDPSKLVEVVTRGRNVMNEYGGKHVPIWITEFGASASKGRFHAFGQEAFQVTDKGLAKLVRNAYRRLVKNRRQLRVARAFWYTWASSYDKRNRSIFDFSGLVRWRGDNKLSARPALSAYRKSARANEGCGKDSSGACG